MQKHGVVGGFKKYFKNFDNGALRSKYFRIFIRKNWDDMRNDAIMPDEVGVLGGPILIHKSAIISVSI